MALTVSSGTGTLSTDYKFHSRDSSNVPFQPYLTVEYNPPPVPLPPTVLLLGSGLLGLAGLAWRRKKA